MNESLYDVCVIGAGIEGSCAARYSASRGKKTLLLEQFHLPHSHGSSHGTTRLVRYGYSNSIFSDLMPESYKMWEEVEKKAGKQLFKKVGLFSAEGPPFAEVSKLVLNVRNCGGICEVLSPEEIKKRFPKFSLPPDWNGTFEPEGGFILANQALKAVQEQFVEFGGNLHDGEKVVKIEPGNIVTIHTSKGVYQAKNIIITAGPWVNEILKPLGVKLPVEIWRVNLSFWEPKDPKQFSIESGFPGFILYLEDLDGLGHEHVYGFPVFEFPGLIKICHHGGVPVSGPQSRDDMRKDEKYIDKTSKCISKRFVGIDPNPKIVDTCMYTVTPDSSFVLDYHPSHSNIVIGAGFSGHGFKMAPLVGKILYQLALGERPSYEMGPFKISRFNVPKSSL
ncbi:peroxisomal sarcosine oxidase-like [Actinia tenebrosa]|uniref:Peroxisomal sarcosine oxidase-like n=1 Tax=Actinia tenebrosa TaxID=6105 RepID=A0A6P8HQH0_ACTTE|nr:peroxisomal sarcosine oxidase-like [Actinia tenebrosa]